MAADRFQGLIRELHLVRCLRVARVLLIGLIGGSCDSQSLPRKTTGVGMSKALHPEVGTQRRKYANDGLRSSSLKQIRYQFDCEMSGGPART